MRLIILFIILCPFFVYAEGLLYEDDIGWQVELTTAPSGIKTYKITYKKQDFEFVMPEDPGARAYSIQSYRVANKNLLGISFYTGARASAFVLFSPDKKNMLVAKEFFETENHKVSATRDSILVKGIQPRKKANSSVEQKTFRYP
tara:strand:- start:1841 stop:2275 length:435 start_codon:yes stop_codon:yes gene_type:complete